MRVYLSFLQWLIILVSSSRGDQNDVVSVEHPECRLYLAESTIPGGEFELVLYLKHHILRYVEVLQHICNKHSYITFFFPLVVNNNMINIQ